MTAFSSKSVSIVSSANVSDGFVSSQMHTGHKWSWTSGLQLLAIICLSAWIVSDSLLDLLSLGMNEAESSQVLLAPVVVGWIAWARKGRLSGCSRQGSWIGVLAIAAGWALWREGYLYQIQSFWHLGGVVLVAGSALVIAGKDVLWKFLPAWAALLFLIPIPGRVHLHVAAPMEHVTAIMAQNLAEVFGLNSSLSGNQLTVNGVDISIVEACNGLRMVFTLFMACYVFAFIRPFRWWVRLAVLLASPLVAIACNVVRLVPTMWMFGHASHTAAERFHDLAGWGMLVLAFGLLTGLTSLLRWIGLPIDGPPFARPRIVAGGAVAGV